jgi:hypothetical protein
VRYPTLLITATLIIPAFVPLTLRAQQTSAASTSADFDFLVGEWDVIYNTKRSGIPPNVHGTWKGQKLADGRIIADEFRLFGPRDSVVALGTSFRVFDGRTRRWTFRYIDPMRESRWHEGEGWREGADMRLDQRMPGGGMLRIRYYDITPSHFDWKADYSSDSGKTWTTDFIRIEAKRHHARTSGASRDRAAIDRPASARHACGRDRRYTNGQGHASPSSRAERRVESGEDDVGNGAVAGIVIG